MFGEARRRWPDFFLWKNVVRKEKGTKTSINFKSFFCLGKKVFFFAKKNFKEGRGKKSEVESLLGMRGGGWPFSNPFPSLFSQKNRRGGEKIKDGVPREKTRSALIFSGERLEAIYFYDILFLSEQHVVLSGARRCSLIS